MAPPKGTRPPNAGKGRKPGSRNKRSVAREAAERQAAELIADALPEAFQGNAHAFLMTIYKDPRQPIAIRVDAAKAAAEYEQPKLARQEIALDADVRQRVISGDPMSLDQWQTTYCARPN